MMDIIDKIRSGKQRGCSKKIEIDGIVYWCDLAIQKSQNKYIVHFSKIDENQIAQENYEVSITREFDEIDEAIRSLDRNIYFKIDEISALKGQKLFNPNFIKENCHNKISVKELLNYYKRGERDFSYFEFEKCNFIDLQLKDVNFEGSWFHSSIFENCNLSNSKLKKCNIKCVEFIDSNLKNVSFENSCLDGATFQNCDLRATNFYKASWYGAELVTQTFLEDMNGNNCVI